MKKELLIASAVAGSMGLAGVAEAATSSFSGHVRNGVLNKDSDGTADATWGASQQGSLSLSVSETTDSGIKISTGFGITDENAADGADPSGLTLTFTDGSKLDVIEAGNAYATHLASVPGATGEQGIGGSTTLTSPSGLTWGNKSSSVGFEWHSAADAMGIDGLKLGVSASTGDDNDGATSSTSVETSYSVGLSYVTTAGDTTVTVGGGYVNADDSSSKSVNSLADSVAVAATAATGNLTDGVGISSGSGIAQASTDSQTQALDGVDVMTAGAKYVSGDITFAVGYADGDAKDAALGSAGANKEGYTDTSASVSYVIASGVSGIIGYSDRERVSEGSTITAHSGSSWYVGALVSF